MLLNHVALFSSSEEKSDLFFGKILGMKKKDTKEVPEALIKQIFDLDSAYRIVNYGNDSVKFEIFIADSQSPLEKSVNHLCIEVEHRETFLELCTAHGVEIRKIPKDDYYLVFISDFDGNLFEVKEKQ